MIIDRKRQKRVVMIRLENVCFAYEKEIAVVDECGNGLSNHAYTDTGKQRKDKHPIERSARRLG